jgi:hypothetical protein
VLLDENKIGVQCVEKIRYEGEEEGVKEAEVKKSKFVLEIYMEWCPNSISQMIFSVHSSYLGA